MSHSVKKHLIFGTGLSSSKSYQGLLDCCTAAVDSDIRWFDTAPSYKTEETLGHVLNEIIRKKDINREDIHIQTKIDPIHMYEGMIEQHVEQTLQKMEVDYLDCLLIHWPVLKYFRRTWESLKTVKKHGLVRKIGICNLRVSHLKELKEIEIIPEVLQIERHPLNIFEEERQFCIDNGIILQDYSPLCKMHPIIKDNKKLREIADRHHCGIGEIILCWHIQTGAMPIFTSTKPSRIKNYSTNDNLILSENEIKDISAMNINFKMYLESLICPGF